jgi:L-ascorbate metabolism protein UlaG (beta-lactamase superfamily)
VRITKFAHACVRIEHEGQVVVIDPGMLTDREAVDGATAVLVTHEHADHYSIDNLGATDAPVFTIDAVAQQIAQADREVAERTSVVAPGSTFDVGLPVRAVGELHAVIHPELTRFDNSGYVVTAGDQSLFHPGDSFTEPGQDVDVLCLPVCAPWCKVSEVLDFARAVSAPRSLAIHDMVYSEFGLGVVDGHIQRFVGEANAYFRLKPGEDLP